MSLEKILELNNQLVTEEVLDEIEESEYVCEFETLGASSQYASIGATWFDVGLVNGEHIDVFCKIN